MLQRVYVLRKEIAIFLNSKQQDSSHFQNAEWLVNLAFLVDITTHMNNLNKELVGNNKHVFDMFSCITTFERKLRLWEVQIQNGNYSRFPNFQKQETEIKPDNSVSAIQDLRQELPPALWTFGNMQMLLNCLVHHSKQTWRKWKKNIS